MIHVTKSTTVKTVANSRASLRTGVGRALLVVAALLSAGGCAGTGGPEKPAGSVLVWPAPPASARVEFVRAIHSGKDLGISPGFWRRAGEWLFGRSDEARLIQPMAVVVGADDSLYVADPGARGVHRFDVKHGRHDLIRRHGGAPFPSPVGLARGAHGNVYVADSALGEVFVIAQDATVAEPVTFQARIEQPTGIAVDPTSGRVYVVDTGMHCVRVFGAEGKLDLTIGRRGSGDGEFNYPTLLWRVPDGRLFVTDSLNFRIQIFDRHGAFLDKFGRAGDGTGDHMRPKGIAADRHGHLYVVDSMFHTVQIFDSSGRFLLNVGQRGSRVGEFWLPAGVFVDDRDFIYVADARNHRVQVFRYVGGES